MKIEWTIGDEDDLEKAIMQLRKAIKEAWDKTPDDNPSLVIIVD